MHLDLLARLCNEDSKSSSTRTGQNSSGVHVLPHLLNGISSSSKGYNIAIRPRRTEENLIVFQEGPVRMVFGRFLGRQDRRLLGMIKRTNVSPFTFNKDKSNERVYSCTPKRVQASLLFSVLSLPRWMSETGLRQAIRPRLDLAIPIAERHTFADLFI